jgi:tol-pal system protein YbgF
MTIILRTTHLKVIAFVVTCGLLAACSPPPTAMPGNNLSLDMRRLQAELARQEKAIADLGERLAATESRLEQQASELQTLSQEQAQPVRTQAPGYVPGMSADFQPGAASLPEGTGEMSPTEVYLQAFGDYASGRYQQAAQGFQTFLQRFPNNSYASNAQFWLGDCYFNQQQYPMAIHAFQRVLDEYPRAPKTPDALLKIATAQLQLGNTEEARQARDTLISRYPESTAAKKAADLALP